MIPTEGPAGQAPPAGGAQARSADARAMTSASIQLVPRLRGISHSVASVVAVAAAIVVVARAPNARPTIALGVSGFPLLLLGAFTGTISATNQRMLLHRARMRVRAACEELFEADRR